MIPSSFKIEIFAIHNKYSGSVTNGLSMRTPPPPLSKPPPLTCVIPATPRGDPPEPVPLVHPRRPGVVVPQAGFVPRRFRVQVHHFELGEGANHIPVRHPGNKSLHFKKNDGRNKGYSSFLYCVSNK